MFLESTISADILPDAAKSSERNRSTVRTCHLLWRNVERVTPGQTSGYLFERRLYFKIWNTTYGDRLHPIWTSNAYPVSLVEERGLSSRAGIDDSKYIRLFPIIFVSYH